MTITEPRPSISPLIGNVVPTRVDSEGPVGRELLRRRPSAGMRSYEKWQEFINEKLLSWLRDPSQLEDEGVDQPSPTILRLAIDLAEKFRDDGLTPPDRIVPDANGGIVFERREQDITEVFHVWEDSGAVDYQRFQGSRLVRRCEL